MELFLRGGNAWERLVFEAVSEAVLEIYSSDEMGIFLGERLLCDWLRVDPTQFGWEKPKLPVQTRF